MRLTALGFGVDSASRAVFGFLLVATATRSLELASFGQLTFVMVIASLQFAIVGFGLPQFIYGRSAKSQLVQPPLLWTSLGVTLVFGAALYGLTVVALQITAPPLTQIYMMAGLRLLGAFGENLSSYYQAKGKVWSFASIRMLVHLVLSVPLVLSIFFSVGPNFYAAIWGLEFLFFSLLLLGRSLLKGKLKPQWQSLRIRLLIASALPLMVQVVSILIYFRFDQIYVGLRFGAEDLAVYGATAKLAELGNIIWMVLVLILTPNLITGLRRAKRIPRQVQIGLYGIVIGTGLIVLLSAWFGGSLLSFVFTPSYSVGSPILTVYLISTAFVAFGGIGSRALAAFGIRNAQAASGMVGCVTNLVLTIILCELMGPLGAAVATVFAYASAVAVLIWYLERAVRMQRER